MSPSTASLNLTWLNVDILEEKLLLIRQVLYIEAQGCHISGHILRRLLESHNHAGFIKLQRASHQKLNPKHRLTAAGATANDGCTAAWQTAAGNLVKPLNSGGCFPQRR